MGRPNPSQETKFPGANGDREIIIFPFSVDHEQDWQPFILLIYYAIWDDHAYIHAVRCNGLVDKRWRFG